MQEGYSLDLLKRAQEDAEQQPLSNGHEPVANVDPYHKIEQGGGITETNNREPARKPPFWRTRKGILILVVLAVIIIGAIVGGAVGGTRSKKVEGSQTGGTDGSSGLGPNSSDSNQGTSSGSSDGSG